MQITVTTRNIDNKDKAEGLREYVKKKASKRIERYIRSDKNPSEVKAVLSTEKFRNTAEILVNSGTFKVTSSVEREDMYAAIDTAIDSIIKQIKKLTDKKFKIKRRGGGKPRENLVEARPVRNMRANELEGVSVEQISPKPMSVEEAVLQLMVSDKDFLAFHDSETGRVNVVYKRKGGKAGLVVP
ncbi:MAG TPA: ribosome-associated translation inhibitor RaiA [Thermodesulfobacteriota bacterium]|nr:ribosome-associated translation inhibitor RaiA [Thermodesulfobacteriota bacterium]